jgi:hypothetical protein
MDDLKNIPIPAFTRVPPGTFGPVKPYFLCGSSFYQNISNFFCSPPLPDFSRIVYFSFQIISSEHDDMNFRFGLGPDSVSSSADMDKCDPLFPNFFHNGTAPVYIRFDNCFPITAPDLNYILYTKDQRLWFEFLPTTSGDYSFLSLLILESCYETALKLTDLLSVAKP